MILSTCFYFIIQAEILRVRRENLKEERRQKAQKEANRAAENQRLYERLQLLGGLWVTEDMIDAGLKRLLTGKRGENTAMVGAIKTQIAFRKKVLGQNIPAKLGNFSESGKARSLDELKQNLKQIAALNL